MKFYVNIFVICALLLSTEAWDTEELEIFDLVEEINRNFYEFMGITQVSFIKFYYFKFKFLFSSY